MIGCTFYLNAVGLYRNCPLALQPVLHFLLGACLRTLGRPCDAVLHINIITIRYIPGQVRSPKRHCIPEMVRLNRLHQRVIHFL